jgi:adenylate cyclase
MSPWFPNIRVVADTRCLRERLVKELWGHFLSEQRSAANLNRLCSTLPTLADLVPLARIHCAAGAFDAGYKITKEECIGTPSEPRPPATPMTDPRRAVFLSYASEDAEDASRICEALRSAGVEVWFDRNELRSGDQWDQRIRREVHDCALFIPIISANTVSRHEGYFRLEWDLADQRSHMIARNRAFIVPVCLDATPDAGADVPESFLRVQWTRLSDKTALPAFVGRVLGLLSEAPQAAASLVPPAAAEGLLTATAAQQRAPRPTGSLRTRPLVVLGGAFAILGIGYLLLDKIVLSNRHAAGAQTQVGQSDSFALAPIPEKSIAVLPFVNMSSDKEQDYFSDGLTEEMIDLLGRVPDLRVPARTSSFYFKDKIETIANIARQLKVAHVLEGSVRKAGKRLRITAQLIRADNGYHLWSQTYDRDDADVFTVQDEIAKAVVNALQLKLALGMQVIASRGTMNTEAYNRYLLGRQLDRRNNIEGHRRAVEAYREAIALDPNYAAAYAGLGLAEVLVADYSGDTAGIDHAGRDVEKAIALAPTDGNGYSARSSLRSTWLWDWSGAQADIEKALTLDPHNSDVQHRYARLLYSMGRLTEALAAQKKAAELDPLSSSAWENLGLFSMEIDDYPTAEAALARGIEIEPTSVFALNNLGTLRLLQGRNQEALEVFRKVDFEGFRLAGIAMAEYGLRHAGASQQALEELIRKYAQEGAYQIAEVYAWRGEKDQAFEWLERAYKQKDGGLSAIKSEPTLRSLRTDPRFSAFLRKMKLPV